MYLMYIDESGDTIPLSQNGKKFLALTGCIIHEKQIQQIEEEFRQIKYKYCQDYDVEIKSNFLRYANPDLAENSPLKLKKSLGICIIDPREGQTEKHFIGNELSNLHEKMRHEDGSVWKKCPNIIEKLLFSQSDQTIGIQIADLFCYPIYHIFEYNKKADEYWRFKELSYPKLYKNGSILDEYGLKYFPDKTKKDLRFFS